MPGAGTAPARLEVDTVRGVELLRVGPGNPHSRKPAYTKDDLRSVLDANRHLEEHGYRASAKLGHNPDQPLLVKDGLPNAGQVAKGSLRLNADGTALLADVENVPKRIAELIKIKGYGPRSSELWLDQELLPGYKPSLALKGFAWLGADAPAMKDLNDIEALYHHDVTPSVYLDDEGHEVTVIPLADNAAADSGDAADSNGDAPDPGESAPPASKMARADHGRVTGTHSHGHAAYNAGNADSSGQHAHRHTHQNDANHSPDDGHSHAGMSGSDGNDQEPDGDADDTMTDALVPAVTTLGDSLPNFSSDMLRGLLDTVAVELYLRDFSQAERDKAAKSGAAMPDGSFPINNADDLKNAMRAVGRANPGDRPAVRAHIRKRAKALGLENLLTDTVKQESDTRPTTTIEGETMKDTDLREYLGLSEEEDLKTALLKLRTEQTASVSLSEHQEVVERLNRIEAEQKLADASAKVDEMVHSGQIAGPKAKVDALKEFAVKLCLSDPEAFETWKANQPKVVDYDVLGDPSDGMRPGERVVTAGMANRDLQKVHSALGVSSEQIAEQQLPPEERKRLWRERTLAQATTGGQHPAALRSDQLGRVLR